MRARGAVRGAGPPDHRGPGRAAATSRARNAQKIGDLFTSFMDEERIEEHGAEPVAADLDAVAALRRRRATWRRSSATSSGAAAAGSSAPTSTPTTATPTATCSTSCRAASGCPTSPTTATTSSPTSAPPTSATSRSCSAWPGGPSPPRRGAAGPRRRDPAGAGALGAGGDPRRPEDLQPDAPSPSCAAAARASTGRPGPRRSAPTSRRSPRPSCGSRPTSSTSPPRWRRCRSRTGRPGWRSAWSGRRRRTSRRRSSRRTSTSTAAPCSGTPELRARWKRGVALVEGSIGEAVGEEYVARHFPPRSKAA